MTQCRSCHAAIAWVKTVTGANMPLDLSPTADGNVVLNARGEAEVLGPLELLALPAGTVRRTPHHATCPDAASWRGEKRRK